MVGVVLRGQDGYRTTMRLEDLMAGDVLLADEPLARRGQSASMNAHNLVMFAEHSQVALVSVSAGAES